MKQVWFVTGSSRGFGRALVRAALEAGDLVAATARRPEQLADLSAEYGDSIHPIALDVTDQAAAAAAIAEARGRFGRLDVIVNNAGYANVSPIETTTDADFRAQFETNFWGVYNISKAAIPVLREQGGGLIMQFSSVGDASAAHPASLPTRRPSSPSTASAGCCRPRPHRSASGWSSSSQVGSGPTGQAPR